MAFPEHQLDYCVALQLRSYLDNIQRLRLVMSQAYLCIGYSQCLVALASSDIFVTNTKTNTKVNPNTKISAFFLTFAL